VQKEVNMQELIKLTEQRINDLEVGLENGLKAIRELNYQRDLQIIDNNVKEGELYSLRSLLEEQNKPQEEKCYTSSHSVSR
jgi:hypothetical protein